MPHAHRTPAGSGSTARGPETAACDTTASAEGGRRVCTSVCQTNTKVGHNVTFLRPGIASSRGLGAAGRLRAGQGPGASPPLSEQGQQGAAGQDLGQQSAAGRAVLQAEGQPEAAALGQGCQGQG